MLVDSFQNKRCTALLEKGTLVPAQVEKIKKNRRGQFVWNLQFLTASGEMIRGTRLALNHNGKGSPISKPQIIYSSENLTCWDIAPLPVTARKFILGLTMTFGWILLFIALAMSAWGIQGLYKRGKS